MIAIQNSRASRVFRNAETGIIYCVYAKTEPLNVVMELLKNAINIQDETGENRMIFDARALPFLASTLGIFNRAELAARISLGKGFRIAALFSDTVKAEKAKFMEDVARNRGLEITIQPDEASAIQWLNDHDIERSDTN